VQSYKTPKSNELSDLARQSIPGASISNSRGAGDYCPLYVVDGKGARLYDIDGNECIDYALGYGPSVLGHSSEHVQECLARTAKVGHKKPSPKEV